VGKEPYRWNHSKWVWRSQGPSSRDGRPVELRVCLGVYYCNSLQCGIPIRPKTDRNAREVQLANLCQKCGKGQVGPRTDMPECPARTCHYKYKKDGILFTVMEHSGVHNHDRPPQGRLSRFELNNVDSQVGRRVDASAQELRTGDGGPGSIPLSEISATLANPRAARYQVTQSQRRLGITPSTSNTGGLSFLRSLESLQDEIEVPFIIRSGMHKPCFIMCQTPFMKKMLHDSISTWDTEREDDQNGPRHGIVTDGDHSFFRDGVLLTSCVFNGVIEAWVPILYTWILHQDILHHRPHFNEICQETVRFIQEMGIKFDQKYLLHVSFFIFTVSLIKISFRFLTSQLLNEARMLRNLQIYYSC